MATELSDLYPRIMLETPSCPKPIVLQKIIDVLRRFCEESLVWKIDLDPINIRSGVTEYDLDGQPSYSEIVVPTEVLQDEVELEPVTDYTMPERDVLKLVVEPTADSDGGLEIEVALRPKLTATTICTDLYLNYYEAWASGVKSELMAEPEKKWSNPAQANYYAGKYAEGLSKARIAASKGNTVTPLLATARWKFA
jgi:hypothetical protein